MSRDLKTEEVMVISIAAFVDEPMRSAIVKSDRIRETALRLAYGIEGYRAAQLDTKNYIYGAIVAALYKL